MILKSDDLSMLMTSVLGVKHGSLIQYNLFAYCLNNPVNMTDAMGLKGWKRYALIAGDSVAGAALGVYLGPYVARLSSAAAVKIAGTATATGAAASKMTASSAAKIISTAKRV